MKCKHRPWEHGQQNEREATPHRIMIPVNRHFCHGQGRIKERVGWTVIFAQGFPQEHYFRIKNSS